MSVRLFLLIALLLAALLLATGPAQGAATLPALDAFALEEPLEAETGDEGDEVETECDTAYEDADEGVLSEAEAEEICSEEETTEDRPAAGTHRARQRRDAAKRHVRSPKKACKRKSHKRHCQRRKDRQDGGFDSRARRDTTG
jgi:hypothetical protein